MFLGFYVSYQVYKRRKEEEVSISVAVGQLFFPTPGVSS